MSPDHFLTEVEAAELLGLSKNTLRAWRVSGRPHGDPPPPFVKWGRAVRYPLSDLLVWINAAPRQRTTSEAEVGA
ncbi:helix-turn-helix transcriptional regulator [Nitrococcus mobilis]|uniref:Helix-turn-helix domain-containing protein n=1 Tax=Nitrococcus mobilis Nb-231 TaxID=314278 RepID=A4BNS4_9GAMM|nr:helix-turn-helix domain-containing protein [Nitrococcus mobilis]EAR22873.1 hypothetical protein NB231_10483 [Nitrococcus mobilis Nb-231]